MSGTIIHTERTCFLAVYARHNSHKRWLMNYTLETHVIDCKVGCAAGGRPCQTIRIAISTRGQKSLIPSLMLYEWQCGQLLMHTAQAIYLVHWPWYHKSCLNYNNKNNKNTPSTSPIISYTATLPTLKLKNKKTPITEQSWTNLHLRCAALFTATENSLTDSRHPARYPAMLERAQIRLLHGTLGHTRIYRNQHTHT